MDDRTEPQTEGTKHTASFWMMGRDLVDRARDMLLEDRPGNAYRLLANGLVGDGAVEAAIAILLGEKNLSGDTRTGIALVPQRKTKSTVVYLAAVRRLYAGRYRTSSGWMRPVSYLLGLGPVDADFAGPVRIGEIGKETWMRERARFYLGPRGELAGDVESLDVPGEGMRWVIFERCNEPPHWLSPPITAVEALADSFAGGRSLTAIEPARPSADDDLENPRRSRSATSRPTRAQIKADEKRYREEDERRADVLRTIGETVRSRAGDDTFDLELKDGRKITIARAPFMRWALRCESSLASAMPEWNNVAQSGLKMDLDNPDHTDWVLGAGLTFKEAYDANVSEPAWSLAFSMQCEAKGSGQRKFAGIFKAIEKLARGRHEAAVVVSAGEVTGVVGVDVAVLPDSLGSRVGELGECKAIIVEKGGPLAHLIIVAKGRELTVMLHPDACSLFKPGTTVTLNPAAGRITVLET